MHAVTKRNRSSEEFLYFIWCSEGPAARQISVIIIHMLRVSFAGAGYAAYANLAIRVTHFVSSIRAGKQNSPSITYAVDPNG